jgi:hypothetical protein
MLTITWRRAQILSLLQIDLVHLFGRSRLPGLGNLAAFLQVRSIGPKVTNNEPCREDGNRPQTKVEVDPANLTKHSQGRKAVAERLQRRLRTSQKRSVTNNVRLVLSQVVDDEIPASVSLVLTGSGSASDANGRQLTGRGS